MGNRGTTAHNGLGLKQKLAGGASLIFALLATFIILFFPWTQQRQMKKYLAERALALARMASHAASAGLVFEDPDSVEQALEGLAQTPDFVSVSVFRADGSEFSSYSAGDFELELDEGLLASLGEEALSFDQGSFWLAAVPVIEADNRVGSLIVVLSKATLINDVSNSRRLSLLVGLGTLLLGFVTFWIMASRIVQPLKGAVRTANRVARGDLNIELGLTATGEPGELLSAMTTMVESMRKIIGGMIDSAGQFSAVATQLEGSSQKILQGAQEQSTASDQTAASVQEMVTSIRQVAANSERLNESASEVAITIEQLSAAMRSIAQSAEELSSDVRSTSSMVQDMAVLIDTVARNARDADSASKAAVTEAEAGSRSVREALSGMQAISESIGEIGAVTRRLSENSRQINKIVDLINDLAAQTNLLSLNASIEAAHAGEYGKGFAVVAQEVRNLAERSASSVQEVAQLISIVANDTENAVRVSNEGSERATAGMTLATAAGKALEGIDHAIGSVSQMMSEIGNATEAQVRSAEQMVKTFEGMSKKTEEIKTATHEQASGNERTMRLVEQMHSMTNQVTHATGEQSDGATLVGEAIAHIASISGAHLKAASEIAQVTSELSQQAEELRTMSQAFNVPVP